MIGERCSKQSTGSMLSLPEDVNKHQYFRENVDLKLLPHARGVINVLMEEAISAGNSSGEVLMTYYGRKLGLVNEKQLCFHAIMTQRYFFNSVHKDKSAFLSTTSQSKIL